MLLNEILIESKLDVDLPDIYPMFDPSSISDIYALYDNFNKLYFSNYLPKIQIAITALRGEFGVTRYIYTTKTSDIQISKRIIKSRKSVTDTLLHEMIHVWQYTKFAETQNAQYIDDRGHGHYFIHHMNRLNTIGFTISIKSDIVSKIDIDLMFVFIGNLASGHNVIFYSPHDFTKTIDKTIESIVNLVGNGIMQSYSIIKTDNASILQSQQLTKSGILKSNTKYQAYRVSFADELITSGNVIVKNVKIDGVGSNSSDVSDDILKIMPAVNKEYRVDAFSKYLYIALHNTSYRKIATLAILNYEYPDSIAGISDTTVKYLHDMWAKVLDSEIKTSPHFKATAIRIGSYLYGAITPNYLLAEIDAFYTRFYDGRVSKKHIIELLFDKVLSTALSKIKASAGLTNVFFGTTNVLSKKEIEMELRKKFKEIGL